MLTDSFPGVSGVVDTTELRKNLAGLITRNADGTARAGVFYRGTAPIGTPRTGDMKVDLNIFHAGLVRTGVLFIANDGVAQSPALPIPSSNSIYHVIYAKQVETDPPYSDSGTAGPIFGIASSDQGATPDVNQAIGRIPAGGLALVSALVPSTAVTTSSAGVVLKDIAPFTATTGAPVHFRTQADLFAWTNPSKRQRAIVFADPTATNNGEYQHDGTAWRGGWVPLVLQNGFTAGTGQAPSYRIRNGRVEYVGELFRATAPASRTTAFIVPPEAAPSAPVIAPIGAWSFQGALLMTTDGTAGIDAQVARTGSPGFTLGQFSYPAKEA